MKRLAGKIAIITGGASGIGAAGTRKFAGEGATVVIADLNETAGNALAAELTAAGQDVRFVKCDVANTGQVKAVIDFCRDLGGLDIIYNNAGVYLAGADGRITDIEEDIWDKVIAINLKSVYLFCKYGIPLMLERGGSIINTASSAGMIGIPNCDAYTATKGAIVQLTKSLAAEYGRYNIRTNCISPAAIMTPMVRQSNPPDCDAFDENAFLKLRTPLRRYGTPEEIADLACYLASNEATYLNGTVIAADGGITINGDLSKAK
ncbi:MAG: glucose 1-dehydrogenase [Lentisphaerae bacterium]|nr:glucose 1-dehydrogenase [Lentisphaerota bacterium]